MAAKDTDVEHSPGRNVLVLNRLAASYLLFGQLAKARSMIKLSLLLSEDNPSAHRMLAVIDHRTNATGD
ncbi:MAG: hypothetical protein AAFP98_00025 [Pseudomonadota bacterium]